MNQDLTQFLAIDPGPKVSAWIIYSTDHGPVHRAIQPNGSVRKIVRDTRLHLAIEMIASYGMPVGKDVFETVLWAGRFVDNAPSYELVYRKDVKMELCGSMRAKDANIRRALLDRYPATGGGKTPQIGTQSKPGPLHGFKSHLWAALGVAETYAELLRRRGEAA